MLPGAKQIIKLKKKMKNKKIIIIIIAIIQILDVQRKQASLPVHMEELRVSVLAGTFRLFGFSRGHAPTPKKKYSPLHSRILRTLM